MKDEETEKQTSKGKAIEAALSQIEKQFGKGCDHEARPEGRRRPRRGHPDRLDRLRPGPRHRRLPARPRRRDLRPRGHGQDDPGPPRHRRGPEDGRPGGLHRRRARPRPRATRRRIGVDIDNLLISQPDYGEQALEIAEILVRSGAVDVIVVDSVAALVPKAELEGEMGDAHMGLQARLMSQALRKLTAIVARSKTCFIFINQLREKIGIFIGNPETTTGGRALKFYASMRIDIRRMTAIKDGESVVGNRVKVKIVKNKMAPPFREAQFDIIFGEGISREGDLVDCRPRHTASSSKTGTWYSYKGERLGQGRENVKKLLKENKELAAKLEAEIREKVGLGPAGAKPRPRKARVRPAKSRARNSV